jgi:lysozyme
MTLRLAVFGCLVFLAGCTHLRPRRYPTVDQVPGGVFLEPEVDSRLELERQASPLPLEGLELTKRSEGFRSHLYDDAVKYCTIAYGHLVKKAPCDGTESADFRRGLSMEQGTHLLTHDMDRVRQSVTALVQVEMSDGQYGALCDFFFNVGGTNFSKSTLLRVINSKQNDRIPMQFKNDRIPMQFRRWIIADGKALDALRSRREKEITLFFEGLPVPTTPEEAAASPIDIRRGEE